MSVIAGSRLRCSITEVQHSGLLAWNPLICLVGREFLSLARAVLGWIKQRRGQGSLRKAATRLILGRGYSNRPWASTVEAELGYNGRGTC